MFGTFTPLYLMHSLSLKLQQELTIWYLLAMSYMSYIYMYIVIHVGWCNKNKVISISTAGCAIGLLTSIKLISILQQLFYIWTCPLTHKEIGQIQEICTEVLIHTACMSTATVKYGCHQWQLLHLKIGANGGHSYFSCP